MNSIGVISVGDYLGALPFDNDIGKITTKGSDIWAAFEYSVKRYDGILFQGEFLQVSGECFDDKFGRSVVVRIVRRSHHYLYYLFFFVINLKFSRRIKGHNRPEPTSRQTREVRRGQMWRLLGTGLRKIGLERQLHGHHQPVSVGRRRRPFVRSSEEVPQFGWVKSTSS